MYIDPIVVQYPEALDADRFVIATYYCGTPVNTNAFKIWRSISYRADLRNVAKGTRRNA